MRLAYCILAIPFALGCSSEATNRQDNAVGGGAGAQTSGGASASSSQAGGGAATAGTDATGGVSVKLPEANAAFDYQLGGAYTPPEGVTVVSRDRNSAPADGLYNICYVNGFQTQPDEEDFWLTDHPALVLRDSADNPIVDADWGELLLDTSTEANRVALTEIVGAWIVQCKNDGFDAVELDNLDSYARSNNLLTQENNVLLMRKYAEQAHAAGLAVGQKNSVELLGNVAEMQTDFAVAEECNRWSECDAYQTVYGNLVFVIEYRTQDFTLGCNDFPELSIVLRDLDVSPPSSSSYVFDGC